MPWTVYLLRCADNSLYTGIAKDMAQRLRQHNRGRGAKYTAARRPLVLVYSETRRSRSAALKREAAIKRWPKKKKEQLLTPR